MIPKLHYISQGSSPKEHLENIQKACSSGVELVQLGLTKISEQEFLKMAAAAREITSHFQTRLLINEHYKIAKEVKADGVHLEKTGSCPSVARKHLYSWQIIGGTAKNLQECETLIDNEVDYIFLAPFRTETDDDKLSQTLGLNGFTAIVDVLKTETPIIAYGDIKTEDVTAILATGISGIGVATAITQNFDSIRTFHQLLNASSTAEQRYTL